MSFNKVLLKGNPIRKEYEAGGTITPGHLCTLNSTGKVVVHSISGGDHVPMFALEDSLQGREMTVNYTSGNRVQCSVGFTGCEYYAILATSQTINIGDMLESAGNGTLQAHGVDSGSVIYTRPIVARALEAVTTTGATARIRVEIV